MGFIQKQVFRFLGNEAPPTKGTSDSGPWRSSITKTAGSPTVASANGVMTLALDTTAEVQVASLYMGDQLAFPIKNLMQVDFWAKLSTATLAQYISIVLGVSAARSDTIASMTTFAGFVGVGITGGASACPMFTRAYGGTPADTGNVATGDVLSTTIKRFTIDFANGVVIKSPPPSVGGAANILFNMDNSYGNSQKVCRSTQFDISAATGNLQLIAQIQKTSNAAAASLAIERIEVRYKGD